MKVTNVTTRGGALVRGFEIQGPETVSLGDPPGCRVAFLPLSPTRGTGPTARLAQINGFLDEGVRATTVRAGCALLGPAEAQRRLSEAGLVRAYADLLRDYDMSGVVQEKTTRAVAEALGVDVFAQGKLLRIETSPDGKELLQAALAFVAFDGKAGPIRWSVDVGVVQGQEDSRFERTTVDRDSTLAWIYTAGAVVLAGVGLIQAEEDGFTAGTAILVAPALGIAFVFGDGPPTTKESGEHRVSKQDVTVVAGFKRLIEISVRIIAKSAAVPDKPSEKQAAVMPGLEPVSIDPSADATLLAQAIGKAVTVHPKDGEAFQAVFEGMQGGQAQFKANDARKALSLDAIDRVVIEPPKR